MSDKLYIADFLNPVNTAVLSGDEGYREGQTGKSILIYEDEMPYLDEADIVLVGCDEERGHSFAELNGKAPDTIRAEFYRMFNWHQDIRLADIGNIKNGAALSDTYAALKTVVAELVSIGKTVVILGGTHDLTLAQYQVYAGHRRIVEATCVDALIDLDMNSLHRAENFLMEMLAGEPNFIRHYNHIAF
ncbi:MAG TPA: arginase family protein, partial [Chitinophagaceae bacterium]|nr:arginase family protein [Chitinophagaceae bacterium]